MVGLFVQIIIVLIIAGFVLWAGRRLIDVIPMDGTIKAAADVVIVVLAVAIIIWGAVIPLLHVLAGITVSVSGWR